MTTIAEALTIAVQHHQSGDLERAESIYRQVLQADPTQADAWHLLGMIAHQVGKNDVAADHIKKAITLMPQNGVFYFNLGLVSRALGQLDDAAACYREAARLRPQDSAAHVNLGNVLSEQGKLDEAIASHRRALALQLNLALPHFNIGNLQRQQGLLDEAAASYRQALLLAPNYDQAHNNLGNLLQEQHKFEQAVGHYRQALQLNPRLVQAHNNLGTVLRKLGRLAEAVQSYQQALALEPNHAEIYKNLGAALADQQNLVDAAACFEQALRLQPNMVEALAGLGVALCDVGREPEGLAYLEKAQRLRPNQRLEVLMATRLPALYQSTAELDRWRNRLMEQVHQLRQRGVVLDLTAEPAIYAYYLAYHGCNDREIQRELAGLHRAPEQVATAANAVGSSEKSKIRVGFLSAFFRQHTIGHLMRGLVAQLSRADFAVSVLSVGNPLDEIAGFFRQHADHYLQVPSHLPSARQLIAGHQLDVLFYADIGMDPITTTLAFSRLAPVQCVTWGHPMTTGIDTIDYFISAEDLETEEAEQHYTERLIRLPILPNYYYRPETPAPLKDRRHFGFANEDHIYACPQSLFKFHPDFDEILGGILRGDPAGVMVLLQSNRPHWEQLLRRRFAATLPDLVDRIRFLPPVDRGDFINLMAVFDVLLDPLHFGGGNTSYEAFAVGTPIVTLPSRFLRGRITFALYKQMGILDCVAQTPEEYIGIALRLGTDAEYRAFIRNKILDANGVLYENIAGVRDFEKFLSSLRQC